jgi:hypothetical protein
LQRLFFIFYFSLPLSYFLCVLDIFCAGSEIAIFEGSMLHFGKQFRDISRQIGTKTIREVIDFYYIWKKTDHYKKWKETFISDDELMDDYQLQPSGKKPKL